jgi:predicted pyridoxine 5'-phosphate oxidase superfamily flavin-nucleotide-binding protein
MVRRFTEIAFTDAVRVEQARRGSREAYARFETPDAEPRDAVGAEEAAFIQARDGFYQATVTDDGWPYVQFRGGPAGFLTVIDEKTLAYADFRGNRQYLSVGNLRTNDKVSLILMDYAARRRLKIWATARVVDAEDDPDLIARLHDETYPAKVERAVVLAVEALDWNCPQHITPRYTEAEIRAAVAPMRERLAELETLNASVGGGGSISAF